MSPTNSSEMRPDPRTPLERLEDAAIDAELSGNVREYQRLMTIIRRERIALAK